MVTLFRTLRHAFRKRVRLESEGMNQTYSFAPPEPPKLLIIQGDGGTRITVHLRTGKVDLEGFASVDDAAKEFWAAIERHFPGVIPTGTPSQGTPSPP